jgi:hypothetical protein
MQHSDAGLITIMGLSGIHTKQWHLHDQADHCSTRDYAIIALTLLGVCLALPDLNVTKADQCFYSFAHQDINHNHPWHSVRKTSVSVFT